MRLGPSGRMLAALTAVGVLVSGANGPRSASAGPPPALKKDCRELFHTYLALPHPGHFYYAEDTASARYACGYSRDLPGEFDRYPDSGQRALAACQNRADEWGTGARCRLMARGGQVLAGSYREAEDPGGGPDPLRCGQAPRNRFFWLEHGFCDLVPHGPARARGVVIWNHGIAGTTVQHAAPPALALRLLHADGWDIVKIARHNLGETGRDSAYRAVQRTMEEVAAQRARGYRRVVLAGQSFGGRIALEAAELSGDVFGAVAMAPGGHDWNAKLDAATGLSIGRSRAGRLALVFPANDALFGNPERGPSALKALAASGRPFFVVDETGGLKSHGGGIGAAFALRYGRCLVDFLNAEAPPPGRFPCEPPADDWQVARALLPRPPGDGPREPDVLPAEIASLAGTWYGLLDERGPGTLVSVTVLPRPGGLALRYAWASTWRAGAVYAARLRDGEVSAALPDGATLTLRPAGPDAAELVVTTRGAESNFSALTPRSGGPATHTARLRRAPR